MSVKVWYLEGHIWGAGRTNEEAEADAMTVVMPLVTAMTEGDSSLAPSFESIRAKAQIIEYVAITPASPGTDYDTVLLNQIRGEKESLVEPTVAEPRAPVPVAPEPPATPIIPAATPAPVLAIAAPSVPSELPPPPVVVPNSEGKA